MIGVYAPTAPREEHVNDQFYEQLEEAMGVAGRRGPMYVMGDWNANAAERRAGEEEVVGSTVPNK